MCIRDRVYSMLKPAPSSRMALTLPFNSTFPLVGFKTPVTIFSSVDFPEPFVPMIPTQMCIRDRNHCPRNMW